jgi:hypothetical protein
MIFPVFKGLALEAWLSNSIRQAALHYAFYRKFLICKGLGLLVKGLEILFLKD